jgi:hypothetical protein
VRALSALYAEVLRNEQEYQHRISGLEQEIRDEKRKAMDVHGGKNALMEEIRLMATQIHKLQGREPRFNPDKKETERLGRGKLKVERHNCKKRGTDNRIKAKQFQI